MSCAFSPTACCLLISADETVVCFLREIDSPVPFDDWWLNVQKFEEHQKHTEDMLGDMAHLSKNYCERVKEEEGRTPEEVALRV